MFKNDIHGTEKKNRLCDKYRTLDQDDREHMFKANKNCQWYSCMNDDDVSELKNNLPVPLADLNESFEELDSTQNIFKNTGQVGDYITIDKTEDDSDTSPKYLWSTSNIIYLIVSMFVLGYIDSNTIRGTRVNTIGLVGTSLVMWIGIVFCFIFIVGWFMVGYEFMTNLDQGKKGMSKTKRSTTDLVGANLTPAPTTDDIMSELNPILSELKASKLKPSQANVWTEQNHPASAFFRLCKGITTTDKDKAAIEKEIGDIRDSQLSVSSDVIISNALSVSAESLIGKLNDDSVSCSDGTSIDQASCEGKSINTWTPGKAGSCSDTTTTIEEDCNVPLQWTAEVKGECSDTTKENEADCENEKHTWTATEYNLGKIINELIKEKEWGNTLPLTVDFIKNEISEIKTHMSLPLSSTSISGDQKIARTQAHLTMDSDSRQVYNSNTDIKTLHDAIEAKYNALVNKNTQSASTKLHMANFYNEFFGASININCEEDQNINCVYSDGSSSVSKNTKMSRKSDAPLYDFWEFCKGFTTMNGMLIYALCVITVIMIITWSFYSEFVRKYYMGGIDRTIKMIKTGGGKGATNMESLAQQISQLPTKFKMISQGKANRVFSDDSKLLQLWRNAKQKQLRANQSTSGGGLRSGYTSLY